MDEYLNSIADGVESLRNQELDEASQRLLKHVDVLVWRGIVDHVRGHVDADITPPNTITLSVTLEDLERQSAVVQMFQALYNLLDAEVGTKNVQLDGLS